MLSVVAANLRTENDKSIIHIFTMYYQQLPLYVYHWIMRYCNYDLWRHRSERLSSSYSCTYLLCLKIMPACLPTHMSTFVFYPLRQRENYRLFCTHSLTTSPHHPNQQSWSMELHTSRYYLIRFVNWPA